MRSVGYCHALERYDAAVGINPPPSSAIAIDFFSEGAGQDNDLAVRLFAAIRCMRPGVSYPFFFALASVTTAAKYAMALPK